MVSTPWKICFVLTVLLAAATATAQRTASPSKESGVYEYTSLGAGYDSSAGWSSELDSALGYSFSPLFSVEAGAPFYLVTSTQTISATGTTYATHTGSMGDAFLRLHAGKNTDLVNYAATFNFTAPTGDTSTGVSTGRATATWNNHIEHGFDHVTPFGEASIGNSLNSTRHYRRDFTTLGAVSEFRGGLGFDFLKNLSLQASGFGDVGYGNQKIFSHSVHKGGVGLGAIKNNRAFETAYLTTGSASLVNDNGFTADLSWNPVPRLDMDFAYNHSLHFATDSMAISVGVRLGHLPAKTTQR